MYENPVLFPQITNRESWNQIVQIADDDTGDLIALTDANNNPLYAITLEISPARLPGGGGDFGGYGSNPYYDSCGGPIISATLADYIAILDTGTFEISIPKSIVQKLRARTYDVYLTIDPLNEDDGRQLLIGRLPVFYGGRNT